MNSLRALLGALLAVAALVGTVIGAGGCGAPSPHEICVNVCEANRRCGALSDDAAATCKTNCEAMQGAYAFDEVCKNGPEVRSKFNDCLGKDCNKIQDCLADVPSSCNPK
jgi:hypothetical protein